MPWSLGECGDPVLQSHDGLRPEFRLKPQDTAVRYQESLFPTLTLLPLHIGRSGSVRSPTEPVSICDVASWITAGLCTSASCSTFKARLDKHYQRDPREWALSRERTHRASHPQCVSWVPKRGVLQMKGGVLFQKHEANDKGGWGEPK